MFILRQTSVKMAVLLHKQAKVPFVLILAVHAAIFWENYSYTNQNENATEISTKRIRCTLTSNLLFVSIYSKFWSKISLTQNLINVRFQIRSYCWEKYPKLINVQCMFIWIPRVNKLPNSVTRVKNLELRHEYKIFSYKKP